MKEISLKTIPAQEPLYHYTKINGIQGILKDHAFFATNGNFLNDTNELFYTLQILKEVIREMDHPAWTSSLFQALPWLEKSLHETDFYVISFSADPDSITLWSEFGDRTGYNLEFNSQELLEWLGKHRRVKYHGFMIYSQGEQKKILRNLLTENIPDSLGYSFERIMEDAASSRPEDLEQDCYEPVSINTSVFSDFEGHTGWLFQKYLRLLKQSLSVYAIFFKQQEFSAEQEYRVVFRAQMEDEIEFRAKDGFLIPYIVIPIGNGTKCIHKIKVAPKNHVDLAKSGMEIFAKHLGYQVEIELSRIQLRY